VVRTLAILCGIIARWHHRIKMRLAGARALA
jgi:hypothetical protein